MKKLFFLIICIAISTYSFGQNLERKGELGARIAATEDNNGILIQDISPNSTASILTIEDGDILLSVDGETTNDVQALEAKTSTWRAGQAIEVKVRRGETEILLKGLVQGKPLEESKFGIVKYGAVEYDQGKLRSILHLPKGVENPPVIFFLQGFSCSSIDFYYSDTEPIKRLVNGWMENGFAVFRVEKPGIGDCQGLPNCEDIGFHYEVAAFKKALKDLKKIPEIDPENIFLFGHSLGGVTAPLIAAEVPVRGIINYGSVATTWYEYLLKVLRKQEVISGTDYVTVEENVRTRGPLLYDYLVKKMPPKELEKNPTYKALMPTGLPQRDGDRMVGRHYSFMQEINETNITTAFQKANCYVLALHGECDLNAVDEEWAKTTAELVNSMYPGKGLWKILSRTEHGFAIVPSMKAYVSLRDSGRFDDAYMRQNFNPSIITETVGWMKSILKS